MATDKTRISNISLTAQTPASDDYLAIDGLSSGTRKLKVSDLPQPPIFVGVDEGIPAPGLVPTPNNPGRYLASEGKWKELPTTPDFIGATSSTPGVRGLVPAPDALGSIDTKFLSAKGGWEELPDIPNFTGASDSTDGTRGLVPAPSALGGNTKFLSAKGSWENVDITVPEMEGATAVADGTSGLVPEPHAGDHTRFLRGDGTWSDVVTDVPDMVGATDSADGTHGLVPAPAAGDETKFLKGDGTWAEVSGGTGSIPDNWDTLEEKLQINGTDTMLNSLGWHPNVTTNYYEDQVSWEVRGSVDRNYNRENVTGPVFIAGVIIENFAHSIAVSTNKSTTYFLYNQQGEEFTHDGHTWYYSGGSMSPSLWQGGAGYIGINQISKEGGFTSLEEAAKYLIDQADIEWDYDKFTMVGHPFSGYLFAGGGKESDYSDATFSVTYDGVVNARQYKMNGQDIINDSFVGATSTTSGSAGLVPAPAVTNISQYLCGDGSWSTPQHVPYSSEEKFINRRWIDGFKLYSKTISFNAASTPFTGSVNFDITSYMPENILTLVNKELHSVTAIASNGLKIVSDFSDISRLYLSNDTWSYYVNPGGSETWNTWDVKITLIYTKAPSSSDAINLGSGAKGSIGCYNYMFSNWQGPGYLFASSLIDAHMNYPLNQAAAGACWVNDQDGSTGGARIDGADWVSTSLYGSYNPYAVALYTNVNNAWVSGSNPTIYIDFSSDGTNWDNLWEGQPVIPAKDVFYAPIATDNKYSYVRLRFLGGSNAGGYPKVGWLAGVRIYANQ